jgi:hypothetical protein
MLAHRLLLQTGIGFNTTGGVSMLRKPIWLVIPILIATGFAAACDDDEGPEEQRWRATLTGANERPPVTTTATGTATFTRDGNEIDYTITVQNIVGARQAHIHLGTQDTASGAIVVGLFSNTAGVDITNGTLVTGTIDASDILIASITLDSLMARMNTGRAYVNVHTAANPAGAIRGQLGILQ